MPTVNLRTLGIRKTIAIAASIVLLLGPLAGIAQANPADGLTTRSGDAICLAPGQ